MKTKIMINGKYYDAEISSKTIKQMAEELERPTHTGFEHPGYDGIIYNIDGSQYTANERETLKPDEFSDKQIRDNWQRKQQIERRLYEAAAMLNKKPIDEENVGIKRYFIFWDFIYERLDIREHICSRHTTVYFESEEAAEKAIDIVGKDDLIWLLRDFRPYVGAFTFKEKADE